MLLQYAQHSLVELPGILGEMYHNATALQLIGKHLDVVGQVGYGVTLDIGSVLAQLFPFGQSVSHYVSLLSHRPEGIVMPRCLFPVGGKDLGSL